LATVVFPAPLGPAIIKTSFSNIFQVIIKSVICQENRLLFFLFCKKIRSEEEFVMQLMENKMKSKIKKKRLRFTKRMSHKVAKPPGALIHVGEKKTETVKIDLIRYNEKLFEEKKMDDPYEDLSEKDFKGVSWLNVSGIHEVETIEKIGINLDLHPLIIEDILNTSHRPKQEDLGHYLFIVLKMLYYDKTEQEVKSEHVSFILGANFVVTFQEQEGDVFNPIRERLKNIRGKIRKKGPDYLLYALMDTVVDNYFLVLEALGEEIEGLEDRLLEKPDPEILHIVHKLKREMIYMRRAVWPLRELINGLLKSESKLIEENTNIFLRDVYDHTIQVIETADTYRDMVSGLQDLYLSSVSNKMNEVMKVLTIIATIFIPLTFIAGIYGMNFEFMPELKWKMGYFFIWGVMVALVAVMVIYFKRKKWL
jgi:magnesium transporter